MLRPRRRSGSSEASRGNLVHLRDNSCLVRSGTSVFAAIVPAHMQQPLRPRR